MRARLIDLGRLEYASAWAVQRQIESEVLNGGFDTLVFVEHDPVITLSPGYQANHLLLAEAEYSARGIALERTDRGGDVTYHGPGQLTIYPIFDVSRHGKDLHRWLRDLEQVIMDALEILGIRSRRFPPHSGVWVGDRKIAAIGVKIRRWVSTHGIALNCLNHLDEFDTIVPCGISGYGVTSLTIEAGRTVELNEAKDIVVQGFEKVFDLSFDT